jgi:hypothetical protein
MGRRRLTPLHGLMPSVSPLIEGGNGGEETEEMKSINRRSETVAGVVAGAKLVAAWGALNGVGSVSVSRAGRESALRSVESWLARGRRGVQEHSGSGCRGAARGAGRRARGEAGAWARGVLDSAVGRESGEGVKREGGRENRGREGEQGGGGWNFLAARAGARVWELVNGPLVGRFSVGFVCFL